MTGFHRLRSLLVPTLALCACYGLGRKTSKHYLGCLVLVEQVGVEPTRASRPLIYSQVHFLLCVCSNLALLLGIEPRTYGLTVRRSTAELKENNYFSFGLLTAFNRLISPSSSPQK